MFDLGMTEILVIGIVALIVVGPKDLPVLFRKVGQFVGKMRGMAREFTSAMNQAGDQSGLNDIAGDLRKMSNPVGSALDGIKDSVTSAATVDPDSETGKLSAERQAAKAKIEAKSARMAADRMKREAEAAAKKADELEAAMDAPKADDAKTTDKDSA